MICNHSLSLLSWLHPSIKINFRVANYGLFTTCSAEAKYEIIGYINKQVCVTSTKIDPFGTYIASPL